MEADRLIGRQINRGKRCEYGEVHRTHVETGRKKNRQTGRLTAGKMERQTTRRKDG